MSIGRLTRRVLVLGFALIVLALLLAGCLRKPGEQSDRLAYSLPTTLTIPAGGTLPGTNIRYERLDDRGAHVLIGGQAALKRRGDSLNWSGSPVGGVTTDLRLRVIWFTEKELRRAGTARLRIEGVNPQPRAFPASLPVRYTGPVAYGMAQGANIPGTQVTFDGRAEDGARLGGVEGYPYRQVGDSVLWEGTLRDGVYIRFDGRVLQFDDRALRVGGLVTLGFGS